MNNLSAGFESKSALKLETAKFGIPGSAGVGNQIHLISESISMQAKSRVAQYSVGGGYEVAADQSERAFSGTITLEPFYGDVLPIFMLLGYSHKDKSPVNKGSGAYLHYVEPDFDIADRSIDVFDSSSPASVPAAGFRRRGTLIIDKTTTIWQFTSMMFNSWQMDIRSGKLKHRFALLAHRLDLGHAANAVPSAWTLPNSNEIDFADVVIKLKPQDHFVITAANDTLQINTTVSHSLNVEAGIYSGEVLAQKIQHLANDLPFPVGAGKFTCEYIANRNRFKLANAAVVFDVATTELGTVIGFNAAQTQANTQISPADAQVTARAAFTVADQIEVSSADVRFKRSLQSAVESIYKNLRGQPFGGQRAVGGTFRLHEYASDALIMGFENGVAYSMVLEFTGAEIGSGLNEEMKIYFPQVKIMRGAAQVSGPKQVRPSFRWVAESPTRPNLRDHFHAEYRIRELPGAPFTSPGIGQYKGTIYIVTNSTEATNPASLRSLNHSTGVWTQAGADVAFRSYWCMQEYKGNLYVGSSTGDIRVWDGTNLTLSVDTAGSGNHIAMRVYNDNLYSMDFDDGEVWQFDGTTWTQSIDVPDRAYAIEVFNNKLWLVSKTAAQLFELRSFDGTTWTTDATNLGTQTSFTYGALAVHNGHLYAAADTTIKRFDGTTWEDLPAAGINIKWIKSFQGNLYLWERATPGTLHIYDTIGKTSYQIADGSFVGDVQGFQGLPFVFNNHLFWSNNTSTIKMLSPIKEMLVTIQNRNTSNPLL